eukprot:5386894-Pleurochrysis_carterae.AAC.1
MKLTQAAAEQVRTSACAHADRTGREQRHAHRQPQTTARKSTDTDKDSESKRRCTCTNGFTQQHAHGGAYITH